MNCRPHDLAVVVNVDGHPLLQHLLGSIRRVRKLQMAWDGPAWTYDGERFRANGQVCHAVPDRWLRPIRPGDLTADDVRELYASDPLREVAHG